MENVHGSITVILIPKYLVVYCSHIDSSNPMHLHVMQSPHHTLLIHIFELCWGHAIRLQPGAHLRILDTTSNIKHLLGSPMI